MRPRILTHKSEPNLAHLVDLDSASVMPLRAGNGKKSHLVEKEGKVVEALDGSPRTHFETALRIGELRAGEFAMYLEITDLPYEKQPRFPKDSASPRSVSRWLNGFSIPMPEVYVPFRSYVENVPMSRGIPDEAAAALLHLVASKNNIASKRALGKWSFGDQPAVEGTDYAYSDAKFLTAWMWGKWRSEEIQSGKKMSRNDQWEAMRELGYDKSLASFRSMISRLGLVVAD